MLMSVTLAAVVMGLTFNTAVARPNYKGAFKREYKKAKALHKMGCAVCHPKKDNKKKKIRNDYGMAISKAFGKDKAGDPITKVKDKDKIADALEKAAKEKSSVEGKTFGDLIKEGKAPGKAPEKKKES
jgi:hypothetical protein